MRSRRPIDAKPRSSSASRGGGSRGGGLKDRGAGTIIRYNSIRGGARNVGAQQAEAGQLASLVGGTPQDYARWVAEGVSLGGAK